MINLKLILVLIKKELKSLFFSPLIYIVAGLFCFITGWLFYNYLISAQSFTVNTIEQLILIPMFGNINFLFLILTPVLTMNTFAQERKNYTLDLLLTSELSELDIILSKFTSLVITSLFILTLTLVFTFTLALSGYSNWPIVMSNYLGLILCLMCYFSVGIFSSSLTENQIVSSFLSFCILMGILLLAGTGGITKNYILGQLFNYLSTPFHFEAFSRGSIRSYDFVYYLSFSSFFIYLTYLKLISRKW